MSPTITFTLNEVEHKLPARFEICPTCDGHGKHSIAMGAFTSDEWAEESHEFKDDYLAGRYDQQCETCRNHPGRVLVVDRKRCDPTILVLFDKDQEEEADYRALCEMERRMGA